MYSSNPVISIKRQSGAALAISLIILLVLTMVVVSSTQKVVVQEKMASAVRDAHVSLQGAEAGLRYAEEVLFYGDPAVSGSSGIIGLSNFDGSGGLFAVDTAPTDLFNASLWTGSSVRNIMVGTQSVQFFIESLGVASGAGAGSAEENLNVGGYGVTTGESSVNVFRTVAHAAGINGKADKVVVAYYTKALEE